MRAPVSTKTSWFAVFCALSSGAIVFSSLLVGATNASLAVLCLLSLWWLLFKSNHSLFGATVSFFLTFQWLQVTMKVWACTIMSVDLSKPGAYTTLEGAPPVIVSENTPISVVLGLIAVVLIKAVFLFSGSIRREAYKPSKFDINHLVVLYFVLYFLSVIAGPYFGGGLAQIIISISAFRFCILIFLVYEMIATRRYRPLVVFIVLFEFLLGFLGYFSDFKQPFVFVSIAALGAVGVKKLARSKVAILGAAFVVATGVFWTAIKSDYRMAISGGVAEQAVNVDLDEQLDILVTVAVSTSFEELAGGAAALATRIAYIDYFEIVLERVPDAIPHENGTLTFASFRHIVTPRILFPGKPALPSDSELTMQYTGLLLASGDQGVSISMGWVSDLYIDFGFVGILTGSIIIGFMVLGFNSLIMRTFGSRSRNLATFLIPGVLAPLMNFETTLLKLVSSITINSMTALIVLALVSLLFENQKAQQPRYAR